MSIDAHTSERTSVGYVLQLLTDEALRRVNITFVPNAKYYENFIMPDALIPGLTPKFSVHVTCTGADNSFGMKRWRYVDEVLQMRSVYGTNFVAINVMFGPVSGYQKQDRLLVKRLFDEEVVVGQFPNGLHLFKAAVSAVSSSSHGKKSQDVFDRLIQDKTISATIDSLAAELKKLMNENPRCNLPQCEVQHLVSYLKSREKGLSAKSSTPSQAFWKRSFLRLLAVPPAQWPEIFSLKGCQTKADSLSPELVSRGERAKVLTSKKALVPKVCLCKEVEITIDAGLTLPLLNDLKDRVANDPRRKNELLDLWDDRSRARKAVKEFLRAISVGKKDLVDLIEHSIVLGGSPKNEHHRAHVLDIVNVLLGWSQNQMQDGYSGPAIGLADPIRNIIPRTEIAQQALAKDSSLGIGVAKALVDQTWGLINALLPIDSEELVTRYLLYRVYCLTKGSSIDPLDVFVDESCIANGWSLVKPGVQCVHPIVGKTKTVFSAAAIKGTKRLLVKCLFGDTGADHKAEEMEARMRIIRTCDNPWRNAHSIFVADGKWSQGQVTALRLGGWDDVVAVSDFHDCLAAL
jgi:hypothetical protein